MERQENTHSTFIGLIREHERIIHKVCYLYADTHFDRQDLYQEIVAQVWRGYKKFRGDAKFSTWLYQVALNTAIAGFRKRKRSPVSHTDDGELPEMTDHGADQAQAERLELLHTAIAHLNDIEKALVMLYLDGKTYDEMEQIVGISGATLRVKMTRIKEKLRTITKNK